MTTIQPVRCKASPVVFEDLETVLPDVKALSADLISGVESQEQLPESVSAIYEWLSLIRLQSPRVDGRDSVDPFISRYQLPTTEESEPNCSTQICTVTWEGFLSPTFAQKLLVDAILRLPTHDWVALSVSSFSKDIRGDTAECTVLRLPDSPGEYMLWEVKSHRP